MNKRLKSKPIVRSGTLSLFILSLLVTAVLVTRPSNTTASTDTPNVILFVGDGMGPEHVIAGGMFVNGAAGTLSFEAFPNATTATHHNASNGITDSAASATAMATGVKANNGVISVALPGNGAALTTLLELHQAAGKRTGLVTTSYMTDATPAAFGAHESSRGHKAEIAGDYLTQTRPDVLLGGGGNGFSTTDAQSAGYLLVTDLAGLQGINTGTATHVAGIFGAGELPPEGTPGRSASLPTLPEMTQSALDILDNDPDGFFLLVEHEGTDTKSHQNDETGMVRAMKELSEAVQVAIDWMASNPNTIIIVTSDHETGGLIVTENNPQAGEVPDVTWSTLGHTQIPVPVYAIGPGAAQITGAQIDNTAIFELLRPEAGNPTPNPTIPASGSIELGIAQSSDDVEEIQKNGEMYRVSTDIELINDSTAKGVQKIGLRFQNVTVPQGSTITAAYLEFETDETDSGPSILTIRGEAADDAAAFSPLPYDLSRRSLTGACVSWDVPPWLTVYQTHSSPDISTVIQEIINRPGWVGGGSVVILISGSGERTAKAYDGSPTGAPKLYIEYDAPGTPDAVATPFRPAATPTFADALASGDQVILIPIAMGNCLPGGN